MRGRWGLTCNLKDRDLIDRSLLQSRGARGGRNLEYFTFSASSRLVVQSLTTSWPPFYLLQDRQAVFGLTDEFSSMS